MTIEKRKSLYEGKAKIVYETNQSDRYIIYFKDDATAFNGLKKGTIQHKGAINNAITGWIFRYLEKQGIPTHFIEQISEREMLVHKMTIVPVEVVVRNRAAGGIVKRLGLEKGKTLCPPLLEYFYKSDELNDPLICENHILQFNWATREELATMSQMTMKVNQCLQLVFVEIGLELIDFKLEFGRDSKGRILLADEFTPDGCRLWDRKTHESMDKDRFRQDLGGVEQAYEEVFKRLEKFFEGKL